MSEAKGSLRAAGIFNRFYEPLKNKVYNYIYYKVQNNEEAEELTQEVFQKVYAQLQKQDIDEEKLQRYIYVTASNIVKDVWKKRSKTPTVIPIDEYVRDSALADESYLAMEENLYLKEVINKLSKKEREIIVLRIIKGFSVEKVSEMLGKPAGTIKSMQFRAIQKLRKQLTKGGYFSA